MIYKNSVFVIILAVANFSFSNSSWISGIVVSMIHLDNHTLRLIPYLFKSFDIILTWKGFYEKDSGI